MFIRAFPALRNTIILLKTIIHIFCKKSNDIIIYFNFSSARLKTGARSLIIADRSL